MFEGEISVYVKNTDYLKQVINDLKAIEGVKQVLRLK